jgi:hypothetical protein
MAVDEVLHWDRHFLGAAAKSLAGRWILLLVRAEEKRFAGRNRTVVPAD